MQRWIVLVGGLLLLPMEAFAVYGMIGSFSPNSRSQDKDGEQRKFQFNPTIGIGHHIVFDNGHAFSPVIGFTKHASSDDDYGEQSKTTLFLQYDFTFSPREGFFLRYGLSTWITSIKGDGGPVSVPNGSNGTSTAYKPAEKSTSYSGAIDAGFEFNGTAPWASGHGIGLRLMTHTFGYLNSDKRAIGSTALITYYW